MTLHTLVVSLYTRFSLGVNSKVVHKLRVAFTFNGGVISPLVFILKGLSKLRTPTK